MFLPTTPNPTSGFLLFVPRKDLIHLDMTIEEGIKLVISGGIVGPGAEPAVRRSRAAPARQTGSRAAAAAGQKLRAAGSPRASPSPDRRPPPGARTAATAAGAPGRAGSRGRGDGTATGERRRGPAPSSSVCGAKVGEAQRGRPAWRAPSSSPGPRRRRSSSAMRKPSAVARRLEARARRLAQRRRREQQAARRAAAAADPAAQLVQLRQAEALGAPRSPSRVAAGTSTPDLDHRGGDQHAELARRERAPSPRRCSRRRQAAVHQADAQPASAPRALPARARRRPAGSTSSRLLDQRADP